mmetsp:Transcript_33442/g.66097  ORF Transcript_33442/g.66097 Transcript_33442/m.66097 type:complete len:169 (+) Transcript_33442:162-668(+)
MVSENETTIKLLSSDDQTFETSLAAAKVSSLVSSAINEEDDESETIPLPLVTSKNLQKVIEFCEHYIADPMNDIDTPIQSSEMSDIVQEWYSNFITPLKDDQRALFEIILAANYMEVSPLLELGCAACASMMRGRTAEEIREKFNITNDLTEEEVQDIIKKNVWTEEP